MRGTDSARYTRTMTGTQTATRDVLSKRRTYRRLMILAVLAGTLGFMALYDFGYPLVGVGVYWLGFLAFIGIWRGTSLKLFDERDCDLERRASHVTLTVVALAGILGWPTVEILDQTVGYTPPPEFDGMLLGYAAMFGVFGVVYAGMRLTR